MYLLRSFCQRMTPTLLQSSFKMLQTMQQIHTCTSRHSPSSQRSHSRFHYTHTQRVRKAENCLYCNCHHMSGIGRKKLQQNEALSRKGQRSAKRWDFISTGNITTVNPVKMAGNVLVRESRQTFHFFWILFLFLF